MELKNRMAEVSNEAKFKQKTGSNFSDYYEKYYPKLIYFTNNLLKDEQKAQDITTNAFIHSLD